jgi:alcohol dehydrogenase
MLGATHACANPVTARYGTTHGHAIAILLPHVVRWNGSVSEALYAELLRSRAPNAPTAPVAPIAPNASVSEALAVRLSVLAAAGDLPMTLREAGASSGDLTALANEAAAQWTGTFNPRPFDANGAMEIYQCAF